MSPKQPWVHVETHPIPIEFQEAIGGHPLVAHTLYERGYRTVDEALAFLDPDLYHPSSAFDLPDMERGCDLLTRAISEQACILVWGDFDVDGQTATTLLVEGLRGLGANVRYHIPVRAKESHGIRKEVLKAQLVQGFDLLLTCDTGITEFESLQWVRNLDIPIIVTDHHLLAERMPPADAVINPQRLEEGHPLRTLPGVGVAYQLIEGLYASLGRGLDLGRLQELVALGIVSDVAEQRGDTRYLLQRGLKSLRKTSRVGLIRLFENAELNPGLINEGHIGFQIAPRLNAVGRLGDANPMVEFLTTQDKSEARRLATLIEGMNIKRRSETRQVERGAEAQLQASSDDRHAPAIVLHHPGWPGGVVGIVASRLVERYHKPVILLTGEDPISGSARSVPGLHITEAIGAQSDLLNNFGGHPMAAGLSLPVAHYPAFKRRFLATVEAQLPSGAVGEPIEIAGSLRLDELDLALVREISRLGPFGQGNPALNFRVNDLRVVAESTVGIEREHRQVTVADKENNELRLIWWNGADERLPEAQFDLVCQLTESDYEGTPQLSAEWIDFQLSEAGKVEIASRQVELIDYRASLHSQDQLAQLVLESPRALIWGEGDLPNAIPFKGRHELEKNSHLVVWTAPPSQTVLQHVLGLVQPKQVTVFAVEPGICELHAFMSRLGSAAKYALNNLGGRASIERLGATCAADESAVRTGLLLWEARGMLSVNFKGEEVHIRADRPEADFDASALLETMLKELLEESRAYRRYFHQVELRSIINR
ncbi:MAG TPA: single-stranded-DNA-specific exonuclease RecJ [Brevefilum fermentans]|nr:single-stranded-DNA-specific exonuclease RecJ [Brevefilum fermentans]